MGKTPVVIIMTTGISKMQVNVAVFSFLLKHATINPV